MLLLGPSFDAYCSPSCKNCPWNISPYPTNPSPFVWSPICLSPPPQWIRLCISPFSARRLFQTQTFQSGGGASRIHGSTTRPASFSVSVNVLLTNLIQGGERLWRPAGFFGLLFPSGQITAQEAAAAVHLVLPAQRGLGHCTGRPIFQNQSPSGSGVSCLHDSTMIRVFVSISVSISKYFC